MGRADERSSTEGLSALAQKNLTFSTMVGLYTPQGFKSPVELTPCEKDPTILGTLLGSPIFGNSHMFFLRVFTAWDARVGFRMGLESRDSVRSGYDTSGATARVLTQRRI